MFWLILDLAKSSSLVYWLFVSVPQTMPRTANKCGNILLCFAPSDDHDDLTNHFRLLKLLYTSYISLLNQAEKDRVFYSILTGDQAYFFFEIQGWRVWSQANSIQSIHVLKPEPMHATFEINKTSKIWMPCLSAFYRVISCATFA